MRLGLLIYALSLVTALESSAWAQVEVSPGQPQRSVASPMTMEIPLRKFPVEAPELSVYSCDAVRIESFKIRRLYSDSSNDVLRFEVSVYTSPPQDKKATLSVVISDGSRSLGLQGPKPPSSKSTRKYKRKFRQAHRRIVDAAQLEFEAEEGKTREAVVEYWVDSDALDHVLRSPKPTLVLELRVADD